MDRTTERKISFTLLQCKRGGVSKIKVERFVASHISLLDLLRDKLDLTGAKESCGIGECGACTVIMNGRAVRSCLILAWEADGAEIITIEGLSFDGNLHPIQKSFVREDAVQCGYCIPGFVMAAYNLYQRSPKPTEEEILEAMGGHLCRCTGYQAIFKAISNANKEQI